MLLQKIVPIVLLVSLTFTGGLIVNHAAMLETIKNVGVLVSALIVNFAIVPALGVLVARIFHLADPVAAGVLLMAMAAGVPFVLLAGGRQKGGSLELAIELAFILPALSTITIPFTARLLLHEDGGASVSLSQLMTLAMYQLLPLLLGALLAAQRPALATAITPFFKRLNVISLIALLAIVTPQIVRSIGALFGSFGILAMLTLVLLSLATGWLAGGRRPEYRNTLAIGTALRNPASAAVIASTFPNPTVSAGVATYLIVQMVAGLLAGEFFKHRTSSIRERTTV